MLLYPDVVLSLFELVCVFLLSHERCLNGCKRAEKMGKLPVEKSLDKRG